MSRSRVGSGAALLAAATLSILVGPGSVAHLDAALDAIERPLSADALTAIADLQREFDGTDARYAR